MLAYLSNSLPTNVLHLNHDLLEIQEDGTYSFDDDGTGKGGLGEKPKKRKGKIVVAVTNDKRSPPQFRH